MKNLIMTFALLVSAQSFAGTAILEFDEAKEIKCHNEARVLGCLNSNGEANDSCVEAKKTKLTKECRAIHQAKMKN